jgi:hypothetical protein
MLIGLWRLELGIMKKFTLIALSLASAGAFAQFAEQSIAVVAVGTDGTTLANTGNEAHLLNFSTTGARLTTTNPTGVFLSGTATSEGTLNLEQSGLREFTGAVRNLWIGGYQSTGTGSLAGSTSPVGIRIRSFDAVTGTFGASTDIARSLVATGNNMRSVHSVNGKRVTSAGTGGVRYNDTTDATVSGTQISTHANTRVSQIWGGNMFYSTGSTAPTAISIYRNATSATDGSTAVDILATKPLGTFSPYDFAFANGGSVLYVASDTNAATGLLRFDRNVNNTYDFAYAISVANAGGATISGARHLGIGNDGTIYVTTATTNDLSSNHILSIIDTGASSTTTLLATSNAGERFRGLEVVPEPASMIAIGIGIAGLASRRRKS